MTRRKSKKSVGKKSATSTQNELVKCDLDFWRIENELVELLTVEEVKSFQACIKRIEQMTWSQIFATSSHTQKRGLNWEVLKEQKTATGKPIASIRITEKFRARVCRDGVYMRFISLHPDHDSAYQERGGEKIS